jgi:sulfite reductase alpha subunit-like flavoprotein
MFFLQVIYLFFIKKKRGFKFKLPNEKTIPIIMIATGTGIAPFRGFWLEREKQLIDEPSASSSFGEFIFFYGCRHREQDYLYMNEIESLCIKKIFTSAYVAFSRDDEPLNRVLFNELRIFLFLIKYNYCAF